MLALLLIGALADTPFQARLLTPDEIAETPVTELSVPQLELERARVEEPRVVWPAYALLAWGAGGSIVGAVSGIWAADLFTRANSFAASLGAVVMVIIAVCSGVPSAAIGITGGVLAHNLSLRRERYAARHDEVRARLVAIRSGAVAAPLPESSKGAAELTRLADERPTLALPLVLAGLGGGLTFGGAAALSMLLSNPRASTGDVAVAIAVTCVGVLLTGTGLYRGIRVAQERSETDARIAELKALPPPVVVNDYWHF